MKLKNCKSPKKRSIRSKKRPRITRARKGSREHGRGRPKKLAAARKRRAITDPRVARALGVMRPKGVPASEAAHDQGMKLKNFVKGSGKSLYRSGRGKQWKIRSEDQLRFSMKVLRRKGCIDAIVRNSRERKLSHNCELAVGMFRAGEDGAEEEHQNFEGKTIGGHELITDIKVLTELEEADELDFESLCSSVGGKS